MSQPMNYPAVVASLILATAIPAALADSPRPTAIEMYGIAGHTQPIGVHHGYHIELVKADSPADVDRLRPHDVIMKVDGESIRGIDHLRALLAEAYIDDGEVTITYTRNGGIEHHVMNCHLRPVPVKPAGKRRRPAPIDDDR